MLGLDVEKTSRRALSGIKDGTTIWKKILPNGEVELIAYHEKLNASGTVLVVVDKPTNIDALSMAAQHLGIDISYFPGL
ncbi:hypothetical protein [Glutamicibacter nicotianae]|uniref:hypothetical protein n=1 Tax=Glutamicibacter nicotianae TaxID=37929 RepID=UPI000EF88CC3|nr:hypothetical protein [Glutamicibacter nicotianae]